MAATSFCIARVGEPIQTPDGTDFEFVCTELADTQAVVAFLQNAYDRLATQIADENAEHGDDERMDPASLGGFGVQLKNRFGGEIEICWGRQWCLLIRLQPMPTKICRTETKRDGTLVFYLDGWHHTEMEKSGLLSREECLDYLRSWLERNELPGLA